jgi:hypothetical protein
MGRESVSSLTAEFMRALFQMERSMGWALRPIQMAVHMMENGQMGFGTGKLI